MCFLKKYKKIEEKTNKLDKQQTKACSNMKCPICNGTNFTSGYKGTGIFSVSSSSLLKKRDCEIPTIYSMCENCGHIEIFTLFTRMALDDFKEPEE